ncbi:MAG: Ig-like domain-containing protein [Chloroflexota bacterium]|nr:Ig-like domain-containing protein [Chloroflexota bacterium]
MAERMVARVRSALSHVAGRWRALSLWQQLAAGAVAALIVAGAVAGVRFGLAGGGGSRCDKPLCVEVLGPGGDAVSPMAPVRIRLAGSLDRQAALAALRISHEPAGRRRFIGDVLTFRPEWPGFARGVAYDVSLKLAPTQVPKGAAPVDLGFRFVTEGKLNVASAFPQDGAVEVGLDAAIMVQFSRSVAPLTVIAQRGPDGILAFDPPVAGQGRWLNTSLYTFTPAGAGWAPSSRYTVRVKAGLANQLGATLDADYVFSFSTLTPKVVAFFPPDNSKFVAPLPEIKVGYNQPVDRASASAAFSLVAREARAPVAGSIEWTDDRTYVFHPARPLALDTAFEATVRGGVKTPGGGAASAADVRWTFTTVGLPRVVNTVPANGSLAAERYGVTLRFNNPMNEKSVELHIAIDPKPANDPYMNWSPDDTALTIGLAMPPSSPYRVTLSTGAVDRYGAHLAAPLDLRFVTQKMQPSFSLFRSSTSGTFDAYLDPKVGVTAWNLDRVDFALYSIKREDLISIESHGMTGPAPAGARLVRSWSEPIASAPLDKPVVVMTRLAPPAAKLPEGVYYLSVTAPGALGGETMPLVVSSVNVVTKWTTHDLLVWMVDMRSGAAVAGMPFDVFGPGGSIVASGTTDGQGVARVTTATPANGIYPGYYVSAESGGRVALSGTQWSNGINPAAAIAQGGFQFILPPLVGHLYTDRPIYRPGETVYFKGVVRKDDDAHYSLPPATPLRLVITDDRGREVQSQDVTLSGFGTFDTRLALSTEASTGQYYARLQTVVGSPPAGAVSPPAGTLFGPQIAFIPFRVAAFKNPEFEVSLKPSQDAYVNGERVRATVTADLFFGAPLADAAVNWTVTSQPYFFQSADYPGFSFSDYTPTYDYSSGPYFQQQQHVRGTGAGKTDASGAFTFGLPADLSADPLSQTFTLEATVTDQNGQAVGNFTGVIVHKGQFYFGMKPKDYVANAGQDATVDVVSLGVDGKAAPGVHARVSVFSRQWKTVRTRDADGTQHYSSTPQDTLERTLDVTTGAGGKGQYAFRPAKSGEYYLLAESTDAAGNPIRSSVEVWVSSGEYASWRVGNDDVIQLVADKDQYKPGETAKILIAAPFAGSRGLVTQERGRLLRYDLRDFATNSEVIEVPITEDHVPNVFVSAMLFKPPTATDPLPQLKIGMADLKVSTDVKTLNIAITPDRGTYAPRDTVHYTIRTTDSNGNGVPAELSLALVDKSVLSLQDDPAQPALQAFWSQRPLSVMSGSSYAVSIDRANELAVRLSQGGKGGGGGAGDQTRTFFPNTAYWDASLRTGADGRATVDVKLPDTLTTWRLTARGVTADTKAGEARNEIVTTKDLIIRPAVPRFLVAGDQASLGAIVHNFTGSPLGVDVSLRADGISVVGDATRNVTVQPGQDALVRWQTTAAPGHDSFNLTFDAKAGGKSDSVKLTLPLYSFFTPETVGTAGEVTGQASEAIAVPYYVRPDAGELTVRVAPSLAAGVDTALQYIKEYPYESAETTVSRFLPQLALRRATKELGLTDLSAPRAGGALDALVQRSLQRLYNNQHVDGGWGWWSGDDSDPAITAWVLIGLAEASRDRYHVDTNTQANAARYLRQQLDLPRDVLSPQLDLRAFILYALARNGDGDLGRSFALAEQRTGMSNTGKAWLALAIKLSGGSMSDPRVTTLLDELQGAAIPSATGSHWEEAAYDAGLFGNSTQTTAQVLQAFTAFHPDNPLVDGTLRWLMVARKDGHWESPHDTAVSLLAITDFMLVRKDAQASFTYSVDLNGSRKLAGKADKGKVRQEDSVVIQMKDLLKDVTNDLRIQRSPASAAGRLYYTAHLRYFTPADGVEAANYGIGVSHEYALAADPTGTPTTRANLGDVVRVKVTLVAPSDLNFLVLEDNLPAGLEPIDTSLRTTPPAIQRQVADAQRKSYQIDKRYSPFGHTDVRDNRVVLFARFVAKGVYAYTYFARATTPGIFKLPPATAYEQYFPEVWGRSDGGTFEVKDAAAATPRPAALSAGGAAPPWLTLPLDAVEPPAAVRRRGVRNMRGRASSRRRRRRRGGRRVSGPAGHRTLPDRSPAATASSPQTFDPPSGRSPATRGRGPCVNTHGSGFRCRVE